MNFSVFPVEERFFSVQICSFGCVSVKNEMKIAMEKFQRSLDAISVKIQRVLEDHFYRIGLFIGTFPLRTIIVSLIFVGFLSCGLIFFDKRDDQDVWLPEESELHRKKQWLSEHFPAKMYQETVLVVADNVLTPEVLHLMEELNQVVSKVATEEASWESLCARPGSLIPITTDQKPQKNSTTEKIEVNFQLLFNFDLPPEVLKIFEQYLEKKEEGGPCISSSILSLFDGDFSTVSRINRKVTEGLRKKSSTEAQNITRMLSGIELGPQGEVRGAKAALMVWMVEAPPGPEKSPANQVIRLWERNLVASVLDHAKNRFIPGVKVYAFTHFSFIDAMMAMLDQNMPVLFSGFALILVYVTVTLGKFNCLEQRIYVSFIGVANVGLSIVSSYGLCSYLGLFFGPIHPILPFLLLGIGVDDMFVIIQALKSLSPAEKKASVPERIGLTLKSAGVSITITSATDVLAFGIGATTVMPSLGSFCLFAAAGILAVFFLQLTIFVSCLALDETRVDSRGNACVPCHQIPEDYEPNECSRKPLLTWFFEQYFAPFVFLLPVKVLALLLCLALFCVNAWGVFLTKHNFDPRKYVASGSYQDKYLTAVLKYFPRDGEPGSFFVGQVDYWKETENLEKLYWLVKKEKFVEAEHVDFWHHGFVEWMKREKNAAPRFDDEFDFQEYLREFLIATPEGHNYVQDLVINGTLLGEFQITTSRLRFKHRRLTLSTQKEEAMDAIFCIEKAVNFTTGNPDDFSLVGYSPVYTPWQANAIISGELVRNLGLTLAAVFVVTLVLIGDIRISLWVFACVGFILVDIAGTMHFWGLTVEIVTSICLILAVGLAVDYSAHVGHMYVALSGERKERARTTLVRIGPAVFNGAFSTLLAFIMLANTEAYVFSAFFKVFFCVVIYGLFHGLVVLPILLSLVGPSSSPMAPNELSPTLKNLPTSPSSSVKKEDLKSPLKEQKQLLDVEEGEEVTACCGVGKSQNDGASEAMLSPGGEQEDGESSNLEFVFYESHV